EMLGNWSFGDYFKEEAIRWAWELLTEVWGLEKDRLHATVFEGDPELDLEADEEAAELWRSVTDIDPSHIHYGNKKDNFWEMGDTGPCGPCSELHIDLTPDKSGADRVNADDPQVIEIWNLVFIQFNRNPAGLLSPLPAQHVDTGMGFERICAVLQGKSSNYDTDIFTPIFDRVAELTGVRPYEAKLEDKIDIAYRVIADHARCLTVALADGATPGNEGRGYVLRRILRRAARHGWQTLETSEPFIYQLVPTVIETLGGAFPDLGEKADDVAKLIQEEEEAFDRTLDRGIALFDEAAGRAEDGEMRGEDAFMLHDTYGFPLDLTQVMAEERGLTVDEAGFNRRMEEAREQARAGDDGGNQQAGLVELVQAGDLPETDFVGYETTEWTGEGPLWVFGLEEAGYQPVEVADTHRQVAVAVATTPFYAEAGGQVGDEGVIETDSGRLAVTDTVSVGSVTFHLGEVAEGQLETCEATSLKLAVQSSRRSATQANHTGTHVLNWALREVLGDHVQQRGSRVDDQRLRFDFTHGESVTAEQLAEVESLVADQLEADHAVYAESAPLEQAQQINGLRAVFGEKYPDPVRVVSIGVPVADLLADPEQDQWRQHSVEFCGGTHLGKTGEAEDLVIAGEESVSRGVRRIVALTGDAAGEARENAEVLGNMADELADAPDSDQLIERVSKFSRAIDDRVLPATERHRLRAVAAELQQRVKAMEKERSREAAGEAVDQAREIAEAADGNLVIASMGEADSDALRAGMDVIRAKCPDAAALLAGTDGSKVVFMATVPESLIEQGLKAGDWIREVAKVAGGGGGGRPDKAEAGGKDADKLPEALKKAREVAEGQLSG
ncbi:MAG: alanine--tRNA ligase, partial [Phycisphaeraceae bacterium]|nr:alanine--tRNA ligase [Phycisphaeraceae bacterium]